MAEESKLDWRDSDEDYNKWSVIAGVGTPEEAREYLQKMKEYGWKGDGFKFYYSLQTLDRHGIKLDDKDGIAQNFGDEDRKQILDSLIRNQMGAGHFPKLLDKVLENATNKEEIIMSVLQKYQEDIASRSFRHEEGNEVVRYDLAGINKVPTYEAMAYLVNQLPEEKRMSILEGFSEKDINEMSKKELIEFIEEEYAYRKGGELSVNDLKKLALESGSLEGLKKLQEDLIKARESKSKGTKEVDDIEKIQDPDKNDPDGKPENPGAAAKEMEL